ncbi:hypothetical protein [Mycolicibacterium fortuitum]|uniref:hypothetical protein n=1 Tax=Mycolicibacterium fortuitum TaxID=1766 RepID=UPI00261D0D98|nr:hypothetical protein [Mycolicibacterium fortuitum]
MRAVAVVNGDADRMAIWHVAVEPVVQTSRLCGAWVTDDPDVQRTVVATRNIVLFDDLSNDYIDAMLDHARGVIDLKATLVAIEQYTDGLNEIHRASPTPGGSPRAPISWPAPCEFRDWNSLPPVPTGVVEDTLICSTIAAARWLAGLADTWSAIETIRASRTHLAVGNPSPLPLPFVVTNKAAVE